jgi:TatA/E family protein of Tat protein translocase
MDMLQPWHIVVLAIVAFLLFGAKRLPEMGKGLGEGLKGSRASASRPPPRRRLSSRARRSCLPQRRPPHRQPSRSNTTGAGRASDRCGQEKRQ